MHLIIIQNGLHGRAIKLQNFKDLINVSLNHSHEIFISDVNDLLKSREGIDLCGLRLADYAKNLIKTNKYTSISFIGHSLGGLIIRYAIGIMEKEKLFDKITPKFCITVATPHLGVKRESITWKNWLFNKFVQYFISSTGEQLVFEDSDRILIQLIENEYIQALARFKFIVYGNMKNDIQVPFETSVICPFTRFDTDLVNDDNEDLFQITDIDTSSKCLDMTDMAITIFRTLNRYISMRRGVSIGTGSAHNMIIGKYSKPIPICFVVPKDIIHILNKEQYY